MKNWTTVYTIVVSLLLWLSAATSSSAGDVGFHVVAAKGQNLTQTNAAGPLVVSSTEPAWFFGSFVQPTGPGTVTNVTLRTPASSTFPLAYSSANGQYVTNAGFASQAALNTAFPNGTYTQTIYAVTDGTKSIRMALSGDSYPNAPAISNWTAAQSVDMTSGFTLQWTPFTGGTTNDHIELSIESDQGIMFSSGKPGASDAINGTNTSLFIPAGTFAPGTNYWASFMFAKTKGTTNAFPSAIGVAAYLTYNMFSIKAASQPNLLFFDGYQQFAAGAGLTTTNYTPIVGANAFFFVETGSPSVTATNVQGSIWALLDCAPNDVMRYRTIPTRTVSNETVSINWLMWIASTNSGNGGIAVEILSTNAPGDGQHQALVFFTDSGNVAIFNGAPSESSAIPIGRWSSAVGTVMTNQLVIDYRSRTLAYSLNGTVLTNMVPLSAYYTNYLDSLQFTAFEGMIGPTFFGNHFGLENIQINAAASPTPPDVTMYLVGKIMSFAQTNSSALLPLADMPVMSDLEVNESSSGTVVSASVQLPSGDNRTLVYESWNNIFQTNELFSSTSAMNTVYPTGTYTFTIVGAHDGTNTCPINLTGDAYPNTPRVSNWTAAQTIVPTNDFTLTWDSFVGGTTNDYIGLQIEKNGGGTVFATPGAGQPGSLNGTSTSVAIPAYTLGSGTNYNARLTFAKMVALNTSNYSGAVGVAAYVMQTEFIVAPTIGQDTVGDGIPDWWRQQYFGSGATTNARSCASGDPDGDGATNFQEFLANTNPTNSASAFRITSVTRNASNQTTIVWSAAGGSRYRVQYSDGGASGGYNGVFTDIVRSSVAEVNGWPMGQPSSQGFTDDNTLTISPPAQGKRYYRIKLVR